MKYRYTPAGLVQWINQLIRENNVHAFYICKPWRHLSAEVMKEQNRECQQCKREGKFKPATAIHHKKKLRKHPELALTKSNLEALCDDCHWEADHDSHKKWNDERW